VVSCVVDEMVDVYSSGRSFKLQVLVEVREGEVACLHGLCGVIYMEKICSSSTGSRDVVFQFLCQ